MGVAFLVEAVGEGGKVLDFADAADLVEAELGFVGLVGLEGVRVVVGHCGGVGVEWKCGYASGNVDMREAELRW